MWYAKGTKGGRRLFCRSHCTSASSLQQLWVGGAMPAPVVHLAQPQRGQCHAESLPLAHTLPAVCTWRGHPADKSPGCPVGSAAPHAFCIPPTWRPAVGRGLPPAHACRLRADSVPQHHADCIFLPSSPGKQLGPVLPLAHALQAVHQVGKGLGEVGAQLQCTPVGCDGSILPGCVLVG